MKNTELAKLNFKALLQYSEIPSVGARSNFPITCSGFCVSCEKKGYLNGEDLRLDQMSHGADTEDFENSICKLAPGGLDIPVAFLLESPGGYYGNGKPLRHPDQNVTKSPPVNCYYWTPRQPRQTWPTKEDEFASKEDGDGMYGPYFAYLINTHGLHNVYFTNIIKCSLAERNANQFIPYKVVKDLDSRDSQVLANCYNLFLREEMRIVNPKIIFYFGTRAAKMGYYAGLKTQFPQPNTLHVTLLHPAARCRSRIVSNNDECIRETLKKVENKAPSEFK